ncbi:MAG TPA: hypothetical protein PKE40_06570 [Arachnia sp.]|nr:hypothetical protein [Arachnia sp.]HMT85999.1 hypothetical protein [Arachnia sp.]
MFRDLLRRDLGPTIVGGNSLREQIHAAIGDESNNTQAKKAVNSLVGFVSGAPLVSLDSIRQFLIRRGLGKLAASPYFHTRLLTLYYRANVDENYVVAGLGTLDPDDPIIHPYDPTLFWKVVEYVFGERASRTLRLDPSPEVEDFIVRLRTDPDWTKFVNEYTNLRSDMNIAIIQEADSFARELEIAADHVRLKVLPRVWREYKAELITSSISLAFSSIALQPATFLAYAGFALSAVSSALALRPIRRFATEHRQNFLTSLKGRVRRELYLRRQAQIGSN